MKSFKFIFAFVVMLALVDTSFAQLKVVTTFSVIEDLVKNIGPSHLEITNLVPPGEDPHLFEPKPKDIEKVRSADIIFANGFMFEPWLNKLISSSKTKAKVSIVTYKIKPRQFIENGHSIVDPHAWNSPQLLIKYIDSIAARLSQELPSEKLIILKNADQLKIKINEIFKKYTLEFERIPKNKRVILTTHDASFYLCEDFGIESISSLGISTREEFKTQDLVELIENIKKHSIKTIFSEKNHHQILSEKLARKVALSLGSPLYFDGLSDSSGPASTVLKMLNYNIEQINKSMQ